MRERISPFLLIAQRTAQVVSILTADLLRKQTVVALSRESGGNHDKCEFSNYPPDSSGLNPQVGFCACMCTICVCVRRCVRTGRRASVYVLTCVDINYNNYIHLQLPVTLYYK